MNKAIEESISFASDLSAIYSAYEDALNNYLIQGEEPTLKTLREKKKFIFAGSEASYLIKSNHQIGFPIRNLSETCEELILNIKTSFMNAKTGSEAKALVVTLEENLKTSRLLLRRRAIDFLKANKSQSRFRNSNLKLFLDRSDLLMNHFMPTIKRNLNENDDKTAFLAEHFVKWWRNYFSFQSMENAIRSFRA